MIKDLPYVYHDQSVYVPLETPQKYIDQCPDIPHDTRQHFVGCYKLYTDEGIANITMRLHGTH